MLACAANNDDFGQRLVNNRLVCWFNVCTVPQRKLPNKHFVLFEILSSSFCFTTAFTGEKNRINQIKKNRQSWYGRYL